MSDFDPRVPEPEEIISTPGADVLVPRTTKPRTAIPPTTPAEIELSGAVQVSERRQARCDRARLQSHAANRAAPRFLTHDLRVHRADILDFGRGHRYGNRFQAHAALRATSLARLPDIGMHRTSVFRRLR